MKTVSHRRFTALITLPAAVLLFASAVSLAARAQTGASADSAVAVRNDTAHTGAVVIPGLLPPLRARWTFLLPDAPSYPSNILIAGSKVFVSAANYYYSNRNHLYALDLQTGRKVWGPVTIPNGSFGAAAIAYDAGRIFAVPYEAVGGLSGEVFAFDAKSGRPLWQTELQQEYTFSAPTARNGIVYVVGATSGAILYALRERDGKLLWSKLLDQGGGAIAAVTDEGVYLSFGGPQVYKLAPTTGATIWYYTGVYSGGDQYGIAAVYNGNVYDVDVAPNAYQNNSSLILNADSGTVAGLFAPTPDAFPTPPSLADGRLFTVSSNGLLAQDATGATTLWTAPSDPNNPFASPPLVVNDVVYAGTGEFYGSYGPATLYGFSASTGQQVASIELSNYGNSVQWQSAGEGILAVPVGTTIIALEPGLGLASISVAPAIVTGGQRAQGTVTLNTNAPSGGVTVRIRTDRTRATAPATVFIPAGQTAATFTISTVSVHQALGSAIRATLGALTVQTSLQLIPKQ